MSSVGPQQQPYNQTLHNEGEAKLTRCDLVERVIGIASLALLGLTVVFIGLAQAQFVPPYAGLITFAPVLPIWAALRCMDLQRKAIGNHHGVDLALHDQLMLGRNPLDTPLDT